MPTEIEPARNTHEAALFLGVSPGTLAVWRTRGGGPPCHYSGSKPVYYLAELRAWQAACTEAMRERQELGAERAATDGRKRGRPRRESACKADALGV